MCTQPGQDGSKEYQDRYRFWVDKRTSQVSFHNNLLLTLGIAFTGYLWSERESIYTNIAIVPGARVDWTVCLFLLGLAAVASSIISGFMLSLSRICDLRITSDITLTEKRLHKRSLNVDSPVSDKPGDKSERLEGIKALWAVLSGYEDLLISKAEIEAYAQTRCRGGGEDNLPAKLMDLRQKAHNLGQLTWALLKYQTVSMLVGIVLLIVVLVMK